MMHHGPQSVKKMPIFRSTLLNLCYRVPLETNLGIFQKKMHAINLFPISPYIHRFLLDELSIQENKTIRIFRNN